MKNIYQPGNLIRSTALTLLLAFSAISFTQEESVDGNVVGEPGIQGVLNSYNEPELFCGPEIEIDISKISENNSKLKDIDIAEIILELTRIIESTKKIRQYERQLRLAASLSLLSKESIEGSDLSGFEKLNLESPSAVMQLLDDASDGDYKKSNLVINSFCDGVYANNSESSTTNSDSSQSDQLGLELLSE